MMEALVVGILLAAGYFKRIRDWSYAAKWSLGQHIFH